MAFSLRIELGNDAMQTPEDIVEALRSVARKLEGGDTEGTIRDLNGNTVGSFEIEEDEG